MYLIIIKNNSRMRDTRIGALATTHNTKFTIIIEHHHAGGCMFFILHESVVKRRATYFIVNYSPF